MDSQVILKRLVTTNNDLIVETYSKIFIGTADRIRLYFLNPCNHEVTLAQHPYSFPE